MSGWTAAGNRVSVRVKTDDGVAAGEFAIAEHVIEQSPLGGVNRKLESWRDEINLTTQGPDPRRERVNTYEAAAAFPDVKRDGGDELKGCHVGSFRQPIDPQYDARAWNEDASTRRSLDSPHSPGRHFGDDQIDRSFPSLS